LFLLKFQWCGKYLSVRLSRGAPGKNDPEEVQEYAEKGVDGIASDKPNILKLNEKSQV
jgi:hypothetical protein